MKSRQISVLLPQKQFSSRWQLTLMPAHFLCMAGWHCIVSWVPNMPRALNRLSCTAVLVMLIHTSLVCRAWYLKHLTLLLMLRQERLKLLRERLRLLRKLLRI